MPWIAAAIGAGGSLLGGVLGGEASHSAAKAQKRASQQALEMQRLMYNQSIGLSEPWRAVGQGSLNQLAQLFGTGYQDYRAPSQIGAGAIGSGGGDQTLSAKNIVKMLKQGMSIDQISKMGKLVIHRPASATKRLMGAGVSPEDIQRLQNPQEYGQPSLQDGYHAPGPGDMSVFQESPDYQFRRNEGDRNILGNFGAQGGAFSGNALKALNEYNSNLASGEFGNFVNRRLALAGLGQTAVGQQQQAGSQFAYQGANTMQNMGDARASGIAGQANMWGQGLSGAANAFGNYYGQRRNQPSEYDQYIAAGSQGWG